MFVKPQSNHSQIDTLRLGSTCVRPVLLIKFETLATNTLPFCIIVFYFSKDSVICCCECLPAIYTDFAMREKQYWSSRWQKCIYRWFLTAKHSTRRRETSDVPAYPTSDWLRKSRREKVWSSSRWWSVELLSSLDNNLSVSLKDMHIFSQKRQYIVYVWYSWGKRKLSCGLL